MFISFVFLLVFRRSHHPSSDFSSPLKYFSSFVASLKSHSFTRFILLCSKVNYFTSRACSENRSLDASSRNSARKNLRNVSSFAIVDNGVTLDRAVRNISRVFSTLDCRKNSYSYRFNRLIGFFENRSLHSSKSFFTKNNIMNNQTFVIIFSSTLSILVGRVSVNANVLSPMRY